MGGLYKAAASSHIDIDLLTQAVRCKGINNTAAPRRVSVTLPEHGMVVTC